MKSKIKVLAIVVSYRGGAKLQWCLASLKKASLKAIVIDNNQHNRGFAKAANLGIRRALRQPASRILLVNQDAVVPPNFLKLMAQNQADIVAPVIKFKRHGRWVKDFGGLVDFNWGTTSHMENKPTQAPDYVSGCAMLIKSRVFPKIGLFDEQFFLYFEDVDFCLRAKRAGLKVAVEPQVTVVHPLAESRQKGWWKRYHHFRSHWLFVNKYLRWWQRPLAWAKIILC